MNEQLINQTTGFGVSTKYSPISSKMVLQTLEQEGYKVNSFSSAKVRKKTKDGFQKHLLRISHNDLNLDIDGLRPEIILINSYDGSTGFKLLVGVYRFACANGLVIGSSYFERNIRHVGDVMPKVLNAIQDVKHALPLIAQDIKRFGLRKLTQEEKVAFAERVAQAVCPKDAKVVDAKTLLEVRRDADQGDDLFTVLNIVQENILKGTLKLSRVNKEQVETVRKMKAVKSLSRSTEINQVVWDVATQLAA